MVGGAYGHGHGCAADHHRDEYTERQRADLDLVLAFNRRLVRAIEDNIDITDTIAALDPDPLRYMGVDEGDGQIPAQLTKAAAVRSTATRNARSSRKAANTSPIAREVARSIALAGGRSSVTSSTAPSVRVRTVM